MAGAVQYNCMTEDCTKEAAVYCSVCERLLCDTHNQVHNEGLKVTNMSPHHMITVEEYKQTGTGGENSPYCSHHDKSEIMVACEHCYQPMCPKCYDEGAILKKCSVEGKDKHSTCSVEKIAQKIQSELADLLSELRVNEMLGTDKIKTGRQLYDEQMERSRDDLDKLDTKIQELREILEEFGKTTRQTLIDSMNERKQLMEDWEKQNEEHQRTCVEMRERVSDFKKLNNKAIVKNQRQIKHDLRLQIELKLEDCYQPTNQLYLEVLDKPMNIPIRLSETPSNTNTPTTLSNPAIPVLPIPTRLQYRESQTAPNYTCCVHFTREGKLLNSGVNYGISGLSFTPKIPTVDNRINFSICENNHHLYLLQYHREHEEHKQYYVHKINLSSQSVSKNIIKFIGSSSCSQHLVVNDEFIIISDYTARCVRVYSSKNSAHLFNIKHECISERPLGVGLLGDTLVVGDYMKNQVSNITINETPEVRWTFTEITGPTGLRVVENPQMILVASAITKQIYILSYQGQKLSTLAVPECSTQILDIAVHGKQIVVADNSEQIEVYEMTE